VSSRCRRVAKGREGPGGDGRGSRSRARRDLDFFDELAPTTGRALSYNLCGSISRVPGWVGARPSSLRARGHSGGSRGRGRGDGGEGRLLGGNGARAFFSAALHLLQIDPPVFLITARVQDL
jgi:hypothetical protein